MLGLLCYDFDNNIAKGYFIINTDEKLLKFIAAVCTEDYSDSLSHHEDAIEMVHEDGVNNSKSIALWDLIYNNLVNQAGEYGLISVKIKRGGIWTAIAVYNPKTEELLMIFKEKNLKKIMKNQSGSHYYPILNTLNEHLKPYYGGEQLNLFETESPDNLKLEGYKKQLSKILEDIEITPNKVIAFGFNSNTEKSFKGYIFNANQELVFYNDYSDLIDANFVAMGSEDALQPETVQKDTKNVTLKSTRRIKGLK